MKRPLPSHPGRRGGNSSFNGIVLGGLLTAAMITAGAVTGPAALAAPQLRAGSPPAARGGAVTWSIAPASATKTDSRFKFNYVAVQPGSVIQDHVAIINRSVTSASFSVYATDATGTTASNVLTFLPADKQPVDVGKWVTFQSSGATSTSQSSGAKSTSLIIGGGKGIIAPFAIHVPSYATPGDHTGGMVAQVGIPHRNSAGDLVVLYQRIVVPIELRVTGPLKSGLQVQSISTSFNDSVNPFGDGSANVSYTVANTGNVRISGTQAVKVTGPFGASATLKPATLPVILPGDSVRITQTLGPLYPAGPLNATVTAVPSWPKTNTPPAITLPALATGSASLFAMPWSAFGLLVLLIAAGYGASRFLRWRRREQEAEVAAAADRARRETERRLAGSARTAARVGGAPAPPGTGEPADASPADGSSPAPDGEGGTA